tara:strand:+ start:738 stop:1175 length:438 start_codon:yes stop_codon:yes gene_type:complete
MGRTFIFGIAIFFGAAFPADLNGRDVQLSSPDRTREVLAVVMFLDDLRERRVSNDFRSKLRVYEYPTNPLVFDDLEEYVSPCPLQKITLPYPAQRIGPVLVHWKCEADDSSRSVGFFFEGGRLAAASIALDRVPREIHIEIAPSN